MILLSGGYRKEFLARSVPAFHITKATIIYSNEAAVSGIATAVEASMGLSFGNKTPFLTNSSHIYPCCNKGALRVLWIPGSSIEFTCSVYRSLLNIQTFLFLQYSVIWITSGRSFGIKTWGISTVYMCVVLQGPVSSGPSLSFSQSILAQVSKLFQWLELSMPFWLYIHDLLRSCVHLFLALHLSCPDGTSRSVIHLHWAYRSGPPGCHPNFAAHFSNHPSLSPDCSVLPPGLCI